MCRPGFPDACSAPDDFFIRLLGLFARVNGLLTLMPLRTRSLRLKLAAWFVLVFFLIQATLVGGVVYFRREMIQTSLDSDLGLSAEAMVDNILAAEVAWDEEHVQALVPIGADFVLYALRDRTGAVLVSGGVAVPDSLPFSAWEVVPAGPVGGVHTVVGAKRAQELTGRAQPLRLVTLPFRHDGELFFFQAAVRDPILERLLGPFFDLVALGVPVGLVAAMIAAWIIAGRAVHPIQQLSRAAQDVSPRNLGERFEVPTSDEEVARLEDELNSALERIEAAYRAQDQFISNVSHELRTPVAVLLASAQVAKMGERSLEKGYGFVDKAELLLKQLGRVVDCVLVLARAELKQPVRDQVAVLELVLDCLRSCADLAEQSGVHLISTLQDVKELEPGLVLEGDAELLRTLVENLVRNAISHSPAGANVVLAADRYGPSIRIIVRDRGPGIPPEYLERVFERFVQVPSDSARRDGMGLGLAIANGIAKLHGGTIMVENNEGGGCSFVVQLPARRPDPAGAASGIDALTGERGGR